MDYINTFLSLIALAISAYSVWIQRHKIPIMFRRLFKRNRLKERDLLLQPEEIFSQWIGDKIQEIERKEWEE